jgi:hypothetical protein
MKTIVGRLVELITFLFSLFGGWLKVIAPPEDAEASFAVGLASVLSLLVFLILTVVIRMKSPQAGTILFVVAVVLAVMATASGFIYRSQLRTLTFAYPPGATSTYYIAGTELTEDAKKYRGNNPKLTDAELLATFEGLDHLDLVWTPESRRHAGTILTVWYIVFILSVFGSIFCLTEGVLAS